MVARLSPHGRVPFVAPHSFGISTLSNHQMEMVSKINGAPSRRKRFNLPTNFPVLNQILQKSAS